MRQSRVQTIEAEQWHDWARPSLIPARVGYGDDKALQEDLGHVAVLTELEPGLLMPMCPLLVEVSGRGHDGCPTDDLPSNSATRTHNPALI